jgi:hypothetical protein
MGAAVSLLVGQAGKAGFTVRCAERRASFKAPAHIFL